jgi:hypothetical protein
VNAAFDARKAPRIPVFRGSRKIRNRYDQVVEFHPVSVVIAQRTITAAMGKTGAHGTLRKF